MIDIRSEKLLTLSQAARHPALPRRRRDKPPHVSSIYRYAKVGVRGVRLETIRFAGTLCTSVEALQRFCEGLTINESLEARTGNLETQASNDAGSKLESMGI